MSSVLSNPLRWHTRSDNHDDLGGEQVETQPSVQHHHRSHSSSELFSYYTSVPSYRPSLQSELVAMSDTQPGADSVRPRRRQSFIHTTTTTTTTTYSLSISSTNTNGNSGRRTRRSTLSRPPSPLPGHQAQTLRISDGYAQNTFPSEEAPEPALEHVQQQHHRRTRSVPSFAQIFQDSSLANGATFSPRAGISDGLPSFTHFAPRSSSSSSSLASSSSHSPSYASSSASSHTARANIPRTPSDESFAHFRNTFVSAQQQEKAPRHSPAGSPTSTHTFAFSGTPLNATSASLPLPREYPRSPGSSPSWSRRSSLNPTAYYSSMPPSSYASYNQRHDLHHNAHHHRQPEPFYPSYRTSTSVLHRRSPDYASSAEYYVNQITKSLVPLKQAFQISFYLAITLFAGFVLVSILVTSYGLTIVDDTKNRVKSVKAQVVDMKRRVEESVSEGYKVDPSDAEEVERPPGDAGKIPDAEVRGHQRRHKAPRTQKSVFESVMEALLPPVLFSILHYVASSTQAASNLVLHPFRLYQALFTTTRYKTRSNTRARPRHSRSPSSDEDRSGYRTSPSPSTLRDPSSPDFPPRPPLKLLIPSLILALFVGGLEMSRRKVWSSGEATKERQWTRSSGYTYGR